MWDFLPAIIHITDSGGRRSRLVGRARFSGIGGTERGRSVRHGRCMRTRLGISRQGKCRAGCMRSLGVGSGGRFRPCKWCQVQEKEVARA